MGILHQKKLNSLLSLYCSTVSHVNKLKEDCILSSGVPDLVWEFKLHDIQGLN